MSNEKEAAERVFFVSARETLQARIEEAKGNPPHMGAIAEGFQIRYFEFQDFERKFEECISQSAVKTKFQQHSSRGKSVSGDMKSMLDNIYERITIFRNLKQDQKNLLTERIQGTETQMMQVTREMKMKIHNMVEEVEEKVSKALNEEIWRLGVLIDEFNMPFHPERLVLNIYKKELNAHVESGLGSNLRARLSMALAMNVESAQTEMTDRMHALVPNEQLLATSTKMVVRTQPFEMLYSLNCQNLCADFQEDLEFKFSWGIAAMIQRFTGKVRERSKKGQPALVNRQSSIGVSFYSIVVMHHLLIYPCHRISFTAQRIDADHDARGSHSCVPAARSRCGWHYARAAVADLTLRGVIHWIAGHRWWSRRRRCRKC